MPQPYRQVNKRTPRRVCGLFVSATAISVIVIKSQSASILGFTNDLPSTYTTAGAMDQIKSRLSTRRNAVDTAIAAAANILPRSNIAPASVHYVPPPVSTVWVPVVMSEPYPDVVGSVIWANAFATDVAAAGRLVFVVSTESKGVNSRVVGIWNRTPIKRHSGLWYIQVVTFGECLLATEQLDAFVGGAPLYGGMVVDIGSMRLVILQPDTIESKVLVWSMDHRA